MLSGEKKNYGAKSEQSSTRTQLLHQFDDQGHLPQQSKETLEPSKKLLFASSCFVMTMNLIKA